MVEDRVDRRLAAIFAGDIAGYSRLMGADEEGTLRQLKAHRKELVDPKITEHRGRIVKTTGDGMLVEFVSVVDAVRCAVDIQRGMLGRNAEVPADKRIDFRVGINLGDVIVEGDDILGDGVNVAARLETVSEPGGICISAKVYAELVGKLDARFEDVGDLQLKNITRPIRAYRVLIAENKGAAGEIAMLDAVFRRPAVAVLPFTSFGDPDQEYFSDGLSEDLITLLSAFRSFPVIARNSSFVYKGRSADVRVIGRELSAQYVIEGSVRKSGNRVRVTAQLIDAETGHHLWADRFEGQLDDIFQIQDDMTRKIAAIVEPEVEQAEIKRAAAKRAINLGAWDHFLRGRVEVHKATPESNLEARRMFAKAIELDPGFADAYAGLSLTHQREMLFEVTANRKQSEGEALRLARRAVELDPASSAAHLSLGGAFIWSNQHDLSLSETRLAVQLNPSNVHACLALGNRLDIVGNSAEGIALMEKSLRLNPLDPYNAEYFVQLGRAYINLRNYEAALAQLREAIRRRPDLPNAYHVMAICLGHLGRSEEARAAAHQCEKLRPGYMAKRIHWNIYLDPEANRHLTEGLRKAGLA